MDLSTNYDKWFDLYYKNVIIKITLGSRARVNEQTIERLEKLSKYLIQERQDDKFYSQDTLINEALSYFFESKGIKDDVFTSKEVKEDKNMLEYMSINTHVTKSIRHDIRIIGKFLKKEGIVECEKRPTVNQVVEHLITYFKHSNPEINSMLDERQYLAQKSIISRERERRRGY